MKNTETKQYPDYIKQELITLDHMIQGKFGTTADLDNLECFFDEKTINIYREQMKERIKSKNYEF